MFNNLGEKGSPGEVSVYPGDPGQKGEKGLSGNPGPEGETGCWFVALTKVSEVAPCLEPTLVQCFV